MGATQARLAQLTRDYDGLFPPGTNHGTNPIEQARWNARLAARLDALALS